MPTKTINLGAALLKALMCFLVVVIHFWDKNGFGFIQPFLVLPVPIFAFLSFYFLKDMFVTADMHKFGQRLIRLTIPIIGFSIIYFVVYKILSINDVRLTDMVWQLLTGHSGKLNPTMWFQTDLLLITLIFFVSIKLFKQRFGYMTITILGLLCLVWQYSGFNKQLFSTLRYELMYTSGRLFELVPYSVMGFVCSYYDVFGYFKKEKVFSIIVFAIISILLLFSDNFIHSAPGFGYSNGKVLVLTFTVTGAAMLIPFENNSNRIKGIIQFITKYTLGIYCLHRLIGSMLIKCGIEINSLIMCLVIYVIGFCCSFIIARFRNKYIRQLVE